MKIKNFVTKMVLWQFFTQHIKQHVRKNFEQRFLSTFKKKLSEILIFKAKKKKRGKKIELPLQEGKILMEL